MSKTEEALLRSAALQNAQSIRLARQRAEQELLDAKEALERKTEELAHSLSVMRATLDSTTDGILVVDHQDNITGFNERFLTMWGMPRNLIESRERKPLLEHAVKVLKDPKGFLTATERIYASGPAESFDVLELADGRVFERYSRVQTIEGKNVGRVWSYRDVTERMRADEVSQVSHALFAAIINQSPVGIFLLDSDLRLQHINPKAVPVFGTIENLLGRDFAQVMHVLWPAAVADKLMQHFRHTLATGEPFVSHGFAEVRRDRAVQEYYDWQIHRITLPDGRQGVVCYFIDISAHVLAQQALRRSEEELRALADSIPQLAWMAAPDGDIFWYNRGWYEYTGTTLEQMRGWGWQSVHDPKMVPLVVERWQKSIETAEPFEMEFPLRGSDGIFRWFLTRVNPLRNAEGRVLRWFGTNTDVDQVKRAEAALRDEAGILDLLNKTGSSIAAQLDLQAVVQIVTDAGTQLSGASFGAFFYTQRDESGGSFLLYALSGAPREAFDKFGHPRATALFGPTFRGEGVIRSDDILKDPRYGKMEPHHGMPKGHLPVRSYLAVPVISSSGEVIGGLFFGHPEAGVFTERTERIIVAVAAQAGIAIDNARLYDAAQKELQERKRAEADRERLLISEKEARERAERETQMKDEFLATVSHELRTPLNAILGWANVSRSTDSPDEIAEGLEIIERNARSQAQIIDDLLDMNRIVSGKVRLDVQRVDLIPVINAALESVKPMAAGKAIRLTSVLDPLAGPISGDPSRLQQILWNLLTNALKFTSKGGRVHTILERVNSHLEISVEDTGRGIPPEFLPHVFDRFRQADASTTREQRGLGLGLSIVKNLAELHGGSVRAKSPGPGKGATFTILLPMATAVSEHDPERHHPRTASGEIVRGNLDLRNVRVLAVDDEPDACLLVKRILENCGAQVNTAESGAAALPILREMKPHVLIMDIGMPNEDGYTIMKKVRQLADEEGGRVRAIALTAFARSEDRRRAVLSGFQMHIAKPVDAAELIAMVASLAGRTE